MPIYEYKCANGHQFEVRQQFSDDPVATCEVCSSPVSRVFHPVAVHFKGKGFYSTDYGSKKRARELKDAAEGKSKHSSGEGQGGSGKSSGSDSDSNGSKSDSSKSDSSKSDSSKSDSPKATSSSSSSSSSD
jgi:putative FmdB family regulatory protein